MQIREYQNPVLGGFHPDPSICRVGEDFYLAASSFEYFPGLPVYHSRDLVNWEQIGNAAGFQNAVDLSAVKESGGIWAPTIRYDNGTFFITAAMETDKPDQFGNFIIHAENPRGPWSAPVWVPVGGIDPSILFEDGKAYYCTNDRTGMPCETIKLGVVNPFTGEILEPFRPIWHGMGGGWLEAPHVYHIGEWYYCMCAEGGTSFGHHIVIGRSKNIWGPYEDCPHHPLLTNSNDTTKQVSCCGHGDLTEDAEGNWWMVLLGQRSGVLAMSPMGRETYLVPVFWKDGWPVVREGRVHAAEQGPLRNAQCPWKSFEDDFSEEKWPLFWQFVRNPELKKYKRGQGSLVIYPSNAAPMKKNSGSLVCVRQPDLQFEMAVELEYEPLTERDSAGVMLYLAHNFRYCFGIRMNHGEKELFVLRIADDLVSVDYCRKTTDKKVRLTVKGAKETYTFLCRDEAGIMTDEKTVSARFLSTEVAGRCFTGTMIGLYASSEMEQGAKAVFSSFKIENPR